jgi:cytochrome b561
MAYATSVGGSVPGYSGFAKLLHWLIALCVIAIIPLGIAMDNFKGPLGDTLYNTHKLLGRLILVLMVARLGYRLGHGAPAPEPTLEPWRAALHHYFRRRDRVLHRMLPRAIGGN